MPRRECYRFPNNPPLHLRVGGLINVGTTRERKEHETREKIRCRYAELVALGKRNLLVDPKNDKNATHVARKRSGAGEAGNRFPTRIRRSHNKRLSTQTRVRRRNFWPRAKTLSWSRSTIAFTSSIFSTGDPPPATSPTRFMGPRGPFWVTRARNGNPNVCGCVWDTYDVVGASTSTDERRPGNSTVPMAASWKSWTRRRRKEILENVAISRHLRKSREDISLLTLSIPESREISIYDRIDSRSSLWKRQNIDEYRARNSYWTLEIGNFGLPFINATLS